MVSGCYQLTGETVTVGGNGGRSRQVRFDVTTCGASLDVTLFCEGMEKFFPADEEPPDEPIIVDKPGK